MKGFFAFGSFTDFEGESLPAGYSPAGTGQQATGRVDVPGKEQFDAVAAACPPPGPGKEESKPWQTLVRISCGRMVTLQVLHSYSCDCLEHLIADKVGFPVGSVHLLHGGTWLFRGHHQSLFRVSGRARRVAWRGAGKQVEVHSVVLQMPARERAYPGQLPEVRAPVNPTYRSTRKPSLALVPPGPVAPEAPPMVDLADASTIAQVFGMLASLGVFNRSRAVFLLRRPSRRRSGRTSNYRSWLGRSLCCNSKVDQDACSVGCGVGCVSQANCQQELGVGISASPIS